MHIFKLWHVISRPVGFRYEELEFEGLWKRGRGVKVKDGSETMKEPPLVG